MAAYWYVFIVIKFVAFFPYQEHVLDRFLNVIKCFPQGGLEGLGVSNPTDVQSAAIPQVLSGANVAIQCYTGSGKTLAYLLPVMSLAVQRAEAEWAAVTRKTSGQAGTVQAVVVAPSRELAMQIVRVAQALLPPSAHKAVQQCIGGANMTRQREALKLNRPILVVGTPGRLAELSRDGTLQTHRCPVLVLDEADQLLAPQFREEMARLTEHCGRRVDGGRQTLLVSATLTPRVLALCEPWCPQPLPIYVGAIQAADEPPSSLELESDGDAEGDSPTTSGTEPSLTAASRMSPSSHSSREKPEWGWGPPRSTRYLPELAAGTGSAGGYGNQDVAPAIAPGLTHLVVSSPPQHRVDTLRRAIHAVSAQRALVFMNFQNRLKDAEAKLAARRMPVGTLHGDMSKQERQTTLAAFRSGKFRALLVSDVMARGLDIPECDVVFNLELPTDAAHYAHRAGRTGRAGRRGVVVTVAAPDELFVVERLGKRLGIDIATVDVSHGEVTEKEQSQSGMNKAIRLTSEQPTEQG